jgi:hypothetical protein
MSVRNNEDRLGSKESSDSTLEQEVMNSGAGLSFATPTEIVEIPSKGRYYPKGHPLHNQDTVEIRYMTAKDEDILTSQSLLKKGLALDRLLQNVIVDKSIRPESLLLGDKNALVVAARITGYGSDYDANVTCPDCEASFNHEFDLVEITELNYGNPEKYDIQITENRTFFLKLPRSDVKIEIKLLTGADEKKITELSERKKKMKLPQAALSDRLRAIIVSAEGETGDSKLNMLIDHMPAMDARYIRDVYSNVSPDIDLTHTIECSECGSTNEVNVPLAANFFWPG